MSEKTIAKKNNTVKIILIVLAVIFVITLACGTVGFFLIRNVYEENSHKVEEIQQEVEKEITY